MEIDLTIIGSWLIENNLMNKPFQDLTEPEINALCEQVHFSTLNPVYSPPYIDETGTLYIPQNAHPIHRYWESGGQSIEKTLQAMGVSDEIMDRYVRKEAGGLTRHQACQIWAGCLE
ncbi:MAG: hypothetical protein GY710_14030 [Desulfobacteraceae bacterium]|nr:hypothetical protein [Desulfobacteraceae bacterium]